MLISTENIAELVRLALKPNNHHYHAFNVYFKKEGATSHIYINNCGNSFNLDNHNLLVDLEKTDISYSGINLQKIDPIAVVDYYLQRNFGISVAILSRQAEKNEDPILYIWADSTPPVKIYRPSLVTNLEEIQRYCWNNNILLYTANQ